MPNYPVSLDALANPTATTRRDDPGFELDVVVSTLHDIAEALEAKLGIGASTPTTAGHVLAVTAAGATAYQALPLAAAVANGTATVNLAEPTGWFNIVSLSLTPGTWLIWAKATARDPSGICHIDGKITDGTTTLDAVRSTIHSAGNTVEVVCFAVATIAATKTYYFQMRDPTTTTAVVEPDPTGSGNLTQKMVALKVAA